MPNTPVPAAVIGLPATSRRAALAGAVALVATTVIPAPAKAASAFPANAEPIVALINRYKQEIQAFNEWAGDADNDTWEALAEVTYRPPLRELREWKSPILTMAGAIAALQFCSDDMLDNDDFGVVEPLLNAALAYMKGAAA